MRLPLFISLLIIEKVGLSATGPILSNWKENDRSVVFFLIMNQMGFRLAPNQKENCDYTESKPFNTVHCFIRTR